MVKDISNHIEITESTLYPILRRLENSGHVSIYTVEHNMRLRKYYQITSSGKEQLQEFVQEFNTVLDVYEYIKETVESE